MAGQEHRGGTDVPARPGPGEHVFACRATDAAGNSQPMRQEWNYQGMGNNSVQQTTVTVRP